MRIRGRDAQGEEVSLERRGAAKLNWFLYQLLEHDRRVLVPALMDTEWTQETKNFLTMKFHGKKVFPGPLTMKFHGDFIYVSVQFHVNTFSFHGRNGKVFAIEYESTKVMFGG